MSDIRIVNHNGREIRVSVSYDPKPVPGRQFDFLAVDDSTYDGDPRCPMGNGRTEQEAIDSLLQELDERE